MPAAKSTKSTKSTKPKGPKKRTKQAKQAKGARAPAPIKPAAEPKGPKRGQHGDGAARHEAHHGAHSHSDGARAALAPPKHPTRLARVLAHTSGFGPGLNTRVGLSGNDALAVFPVAAYAVLFAYFWRNKDRVVGDYMQGEEEFERAEPVRVAAQMGLRFRTTVADQMGAFNTTTPTERVAREQQFVRFVARMHELGRAGGVAGEGGLDLDGNAGGSVAPIAVRTTIVTGAARSDPAEQPLQDPGLHNTDCTTLFPQTSWWKARYMAEPVFRAEDSTFKLAPSDPPKPHRFMPMSYYLEGTAESGARVLLYGPVKSFKAEVDRDVTVPGPHEDIAWKMALELVDTNWRQESGQPGVNKVFKLVCSQQNDRCVFSALVGKDGGAFSVFISRFELRLESDAVAVTDDVLERFHSSGEVGPKAEALLTLHPGRDLFLSYLVRSLSLLDATVVWKREANTILVGALEVDGYLPLEVHLKSDESLPGSQSSFAALPVKRIMLRFKSTPPEVGDVEPDSAAVESVQLMLPGDRILSQDQANKVLWILDNEALDKTATVDLVLLNRTPVGPEERTAGLTGGALAPVPNGHLRFYDFPGIRQVYKQINVSVRRQEGVRALRPAQPWSDLRVDPQENSMDPALAFLKDLTLDDRVQMEMTRMSKDLRVQVPLGAGLILVLLGWVGVLTPGVVSVLGVVAGVAAFLTAAALAALTFMEHSGKEEESVSEAAWEFLEDNRPYEKTVFAAVSGVVACSAMALMAGCRAVPEGLSPSLAASALVGMVASAHLVSLAVSTPEQPSPAVQSLRVGLLAVATGALLVVGLEMMKVARTARSLPVTAGEGGPGAADSYIRDAMPNPPAVLGGAAALAVGYGVFKLATSERADKCDPVGFQAQKTLLGLEAAAGELEAAQREAAALGGGPDDADDADDADGEVGGDGEDGGNGEGATINEDKERALLRLERAKRALSAYRVEAQGIEEKARACLAENKAAFVGAAALDEKYSKYVDYVPVLFGIAFIAGAGLAVLACLAMSRAAPSSILEYTAGHTPEQLQAGRRLGRYGPDSRIKDGRGSKAAWVIRVGLGALLVGGAVSLVAEQDKPPDATYCSHLEETEASIRATVRDNGLLVEGSRLLEEVHQGQRQYGCTIVQDKARNVTLAVLLAMLCAAFLAPTKKYAAASRPCAGVVLVQVVGFLVLAAASVAVYDSRGSLLRTL
jgi:hypothetical protein